MSEATVRQLKRKAAKRPAPRTVTVAIEGGDFDGWEATARADFPAALLEDLQSGSISRIIAVLDAIVTDHNMPDSEDNVAAKMADVDPYAGLMEVANAIFDKIGKLPNR
jgi:uncharacterized tellurite resistance protein B-like protein